MHTMSDALKSRFPAADRHLISLALAAAAARLVFGPPCLISTAPR